MLLYDILILTCVHIGVYTEMLTSCSRNDSSDSLTISRSG